MFEMIKISQGKKSLHLKVTDDQLKSTNNLPHKRLLYRTLTNNKCYFNEMKCLCR